jgi:histone acetyltransferase (RNA polymerase elongator complex component)
MELRPRPLIIPVFVPHLGCPHRCVFCDQFSITGSALARPSAEDVRDIIRRFLCFKGKQRGHTELAFYGGNFLGLSSAYRESLLDAVQTSIEDGRVAGIRFSTRPESVTELSVKALLSRSITAVEIGVQSMDDLVLALSQRGHCAQDSAEAVRILKRYGLQVGIQIMPGLPGDTFASAFRTGREVVGLAPDFVRIYPTVVVRNTVLEAWYREGKYVPLALGEAVEITKQLYLLFKGHGIPVIRMGLHPSESLLEHDNVVAGPFHPAFGHLVHAAVFHDLAAKILAEHQGRSRRMILRVHPRDVSKMTGQKKDNLTSLSLQLGIETLTVVADPSVEQDTLRVESDLPSC